MFFPCFLLNHLGRAPSVRRPGMVLLPQLTSCGGFLKPVTKACCQAWCLMPEDANIQDKLITFIYILICNISYMERHYYTIFYILYYMSTVHISVYIILNYMMNYVYICIYIIYIYIYNIIYIYIYIYCIYIYIHILYIYNIVYI